MKTKSEVIKLLKEGTHCILVDTNTNVQTDLLREICNELSALGVKTPLNLVFFDSEKTFPYDEIKLSSIQKDVIEPDNEKPYLFYEGEKYYFGQEYEFSNYDKWFNRKLLAFHCISRFVSNRNESFTKIRKIDHTSKYKKRLLELKIQAEKDGVNLKELL